MTVRVVSSRSAHSSPGAFINGVCADFDFENAMPTRLNAIPPRGGQAYCNTFERCVAHTDANQNPSKGFPPIANPDASILILGSMPGRRSISAAEYYAHPQNAFWPIMEALLGVRGEYLQRCDQLRQMRVALWDVLGKTVRPGSLDADIQLDTAIPNDFAGFFAAHANIEVVGFNGKKAESLFNRFVRSTIDCEPLKFFSLPSTSPAYAAMPYTAKREAWHKVLCPPVRPTV
jgi:hypoxanthine-DNA glycosylase